MKQCDKFVIFFSILGVILGFSLVMCIGEDNINKFLFQKSYTPDSIPNSEAEIISNCKGLNLTDAVRCVRDNVQTFYFYNVTIESHTDIETLKKVGGDCLNWAKFYVRLSDDLGFDSELVYIEDNGLKVHAIPLISNGKGYCIIDNLKMDCREYGE